MTPKQYLELCEANGPKSPEFRGAVESVLHDLAKVSCPLPLRLSLSTLEDSAGSVWRTWIQREPEPYRKAIEALGWRCTLEHDGFNIPAAFILDVLMADALKGDAK